MSDPTPLLTPPFLILQPGDASSSCSRPETETLEGEGDPDLLSSCKWNHRLRFPISTRGTVSVIKKEKKPRSEVRANPLSDHVRVWVEKKMESGVDERDCELPFLTGAPKLIGCRMCNRCIYDGEEVICTSRGCQQVFHTKCVKEMMGKATLKEFKCSKHACFLCKKFAPLRCVQCNIALHIGCAPWPEAVIQFSKTHALCWRHPEDWRLDKEHDAPTSDIEEAFHRLPLPYIDEEFKIGTILKDVTGNKTEPCPYVHIRRNVYLVKKKRDGAEANVGCSNCNADSTCSDDCECRGLSISCSKACHCSEMCTNRPFRKEKRIRVIKTKLCGWGVVALEPMEKGEFVIEYIGEVIDDALCEQRLWDIKYRGDQNFYMCEIRKDFTIDATFKGNGSRFLNHSCEPNCKLERWQVDGETRVGVFTARSIEVGEPLTYDYRFVHFGPMVMCFCGSRNCQGYLGSKRKTNQLPCWEANQSTELKTDQLGSWGSKRKRNMIMKA